MCEASQRTSEPQDTEADIDGARAAIVRALVKRSVLPPYEELVGQHEALLRHIQALLPLAEHRIGRLSRSSAGWYEKRCKLNAIPHMVAQGLGPGLQSAEVHVRSLGYACQFLLENSGRIEGPRP